MRVCVRVCVRACVRACVCVCVLTCVSSSVSIVMATSFFLVGGAGVDGTGIAGVEPYSHASPICLLLTASNTQKLKSSKNTCEQRRPEPFITEWSQGVLLLQTAH